MTDNQSLLAKLRQATGASRELDAEIAVALGWKAWRSKHGYWNFDGPNGERVNTYSDRQPPRYDPDTGRKNADYDATPWARLAELADLPMWTESLDAALTLVPEGWAWSLWADVNGQGYQAGVSPEAPTDEWTHSDCEGIDAAGATPALALCIAALEAREKE